MSRTLVPNSMIANPAVSIISAPNTSGPMTIATDTMVYRSYTDASNYERLHVGAIGSGAGLMYEPAGTGVARNVYIGNAGATGALFFRTNNADRWQIDLAGNLRAATDNTVDVGFSVASGRPRDLWLGRDLSVGRNLDFPGTAKRITADFSGQADMANRGAFQTNVANGPTYVMAIPNGTSRNSGFQINNTLPLTDTAYGSFAIDSAAVSIISNAQGVGVALPFLINVAGTERLRIGTDGHISMGTTAFMRGVSTGSIEIEAPSQYLFLTSLSGSHLAGNAYWDGSNWFRYNTGLSAATWIVNNNGITYYGDPGSGAAAIPWANRFSMDCTGRARFYYASNNAGDATIQIANGAFINGMDTSGASRPFLAVTGDNFNAYYCGTAGMLFTNYANTARIGVLDNNGYMRVNQYGFYADATQYLTGTTTSAKMPSSRVIRFNAGGIDFSPAAHDQDKIIFVAADYSTPANSGIGGDVNGAACLFTHQSWADIRFRQNNVAGAVYHRFNVNSGEAAHGGGSYVGSNCLMSVHANYYGGVYYSTTNQFVAWPSMTLYKPDAAPLATSSLYEALDNPRLAGLAYHRIEHDFDWPEDEIAQVTDDALNEPIPLKVKEQKYPSVRPSDRVDPRLTYGFRVEDWLDAFPDLCVEGPGDVMGFNMIGMVPITWEALRALFRQVQALEARVQELEGVC